ncbi:MAG: A/G-specific adenine glycosylase [Chromatium okenii]|nr:A/G-specific adenine glycosylase [Chromatium okenii]
MTDFSPNNFAAALLIWFDQHGRHHLPWQHNPTPYRVWVSEILLQQTQVSVVIPYFQRFIAQFPTVQILADAPLDAVLAVWAGLGYYARARNLHRAAQCIRDQHQGEFPLDLKQLQALPGIGRSTAGAILALATNQSQPILDGNVKRVLTRCFAIDGWPGQPAVEAQLWTLAAQLTPTLCVAAYTQAMMDLGATVCTRHAPACDRCPLTARCRARIEQRQQQLPAPRPRQPLPERLVMVAIIRNSRGEILLERRAPSGIWGGLWSVPEISGDPIAWCVERFGERPQQLTTLRPRRHTLTHLRLNLQPVIMQLNGVNHEGIDQTHQRWLADGDLATIGLPAPIQKLLTAMLTFTPLGID